MKEKIEKLLCKPWAAYTLAAVCAVLLYTVLGNIKPILEALGKVTDFLSPVIIGIAVAYLFNAAVEFFKKKLFAKMKKDTARHAAGVTFVIVLVAVFVILLLVALIPSIIKSVSSVIANWSYYTEKGTELYEKLLAFMEKKNINVDLSKIKAYGDNMFDSIFNLIKNNGKTILGTLSDVRTGVSNFGVGVCFGFCFLYAKSTLVNFINRIRRAVFYEEKLARHNELFSRCNNVFIRYTVSTLLDALIIGIATLVFVLIMRMPFAPLIALICAIANIIPTFGPLIGTILSMFFLVLDKPINAVWFLIFYCLLQCVEGMVIKPRLMKDSLGIPAAWTLILLVLGSKIAGIIGIILSIPVAAIVAIIYREYIIPRLEKRAEKLNGAKKEETPADTSAENDGKAE